MAASCKPGVIRGCGSIRFPCDAGRQQLFLRRARRELGLTCGELARELGVSARTVEKWSLRAGSGDRREMPLMADRPVPGMHYPPR